MSYSDFEDYYIVFRCSNRKSESRFSRLRQFILSVIARLMFRIRKKFSKIVINGKPLCKEPEDLPPDIQRLSYKQLKKIKEALAKLDLGDQTVSASRLGYLAPPPTPRSGDDDIEIEVLKVDERVPEVNDVTETNVSTSYAENSDVHVQTESEELESGVKRKMNRKPRPKPAKGRRTEIAIPPFVPTDGEEITTTKNLKRKRPKAAKGQRKPCVEHLTDLPADFLIESFQSAEERCRAKARRRPMTPIPPKYVFSTEEDDDINAKINEIVKDMQSPATKRNYRKERKQLPPITENGTDEEENTDDDVDEDAIFNVPYLPKSQRKYAKDGLTVPWLK